MGERLGQSISPRFFAFPDMFVAIVLSKLLLRRVAALSTCSRFQGGCPWLNYLRTFGAFDFPGFQGHCPG